jgi:hypothetical protein
MMNKEASPGMKAVEFESTIAPSGQLALPPEIANEIPAGERLHVVVMWGPSDFDLTWRDAGRRRFEAAYSPDDAVYEQLLDAPTTR